MLVDKAGFDQELRDLLLEVVESSKRFPGIKEMAANSMTVFNLSGFSFSCMDFRDVRIPGANLKIPFVGIRISERLI